MYLLFSYFIILLQGMDKNAFEKKYNTIGVNIFRTHQLFCQEVLKLNPGEIGVVSNGKVSRKSSGSLFSASLIQGSQTFFSCVIPDAKHKGWLSYARHARQVSTQIKWPLRWPVHATPSVSSPLPPLMITLNANTDVLVGIAFILF